jgi:hypothetical protein
MSIRQFTSLLCLTLGLGATTGFTAPNDENSRAENFFKVTFEPTFPISLQMGGIDEGSATVLLVIDKTGQLTDYLLVEASHPFFGKAVTDVLPSWEFNPRKIDGQPVNSVRRLFVEFESNGSIISLTPSLALEALIPGVGRQNQKRQAYSVASLRELDHLPKPIKIVEPYLYRSAGEQNYGLRVVFHFFIDEAGRVRIPIADESTLQAIDELLLEAVHKALVQWEFTPPTVDGKPVVVRAAQPFQIFKKTSE